MEEQLKELFKKIFQVQKVTFDTWDPNDESVREQKCLFIEIASSKVAFRKQAEVQMVQGSAIIVARAEEIPVGFFAKAIEKAGLSPEGDLTKDLFFFDFETNNRRFRDIVVRGFSYVYFFRGQYDPDTGSIETVDITVEQET